MADHRIPRIKEALRLHMLRLPSRQAPPALPRGARSAGPAGDVLAKIQIDPIDLAWLQGGGTCQDPVPDGSQPKVAGPSLMPDVAGSPVAQRLSDALPEIMARRSVEGLHVNWRDVQGVPQDLARGVVVAVMDALQKRLGLVSPRIEVATVTSDSGELLGSVVTISVVERVPDVYGSRLDEVRGTVVFDSDGRQLTAPCTVRSFGG